MSTTNTRLDLRIQMSKFQVGNTWLEFSSSRYGVDMGSIRDRIMLFVGVHQPTRDEGVSEHGSLGTAGVDQIDQTGDGPDGAGQFEVSASDGLNGIKQRF
jgi:hypothetical protein